MITNFSIPYSSKAQALNIRDTLEALGYTIHPAFVEATMDSHDRGFLLPSNASVRRINDSPVIRGNSNPEGQYQTMNLEQFIQAHFAEKRSKESLREQKEAQKKLDALLPKMAELQAQVDELKKIIGGN